MTSPTTPYPTADRPPPLYAELRRVAHRLMQNERRGTLQATALVHEAFLRLGGEAIWEQLDATTDRHALVRRAAHVMREVLVDRARHRSAAKRGGGWRRQSLENVHAERLPHAVLLELHEALEDLADVDPQLVRVVELRVFAELTHADAAQVLGVSEATAKRLWRLGLSWLRRRLSE